MTAASVGGAAEKKAVKGKSYGSALVSFCCILSAVYAAYACGSLVHPVIITQWISKSCKIGAALALVVCCKTGAPA